MGQIGRWGLDGRGRAGASWRGGVVSVVRERGALKGQASAEGLVISDTRRTITTRASSVSYLSAAAYSAFSARLPAIPAHQTAHRTRSRFGVVVATCFVRCTLLYLFQHDRPCFFVASLSPALITCTQSPRAQELGRYVLEKASYRIQKHQQQQQCL